jgi:hypothetical protein
MKKAKKGRKDPVQLEVDRVLDAVRAAVGSCDRAVPEAALLDALMGEAEGWRMRLQELDLGSEDEE